MKEHKKKLKKARRMLTWKEIKARVSPFMSKAWEARKKARAEKVKKAEEKQHGTNKKTIRN